MTPSVGVQRNSPSAEGYTPLVVRLLDSIRGLYRLASVQGDTPVFPIQYLATKIDRPVHVVRNALILFIFSTLLLDPGGYAPILSRSLLFLAGAWGTLSHITKDPSIPHSQNNAQTLEGAGVSEGSKAWLDFWIIYTLTTALEEVGYEVIMILCPVWALVKVAIGGHLIAQAYGLRRREKVHNPRSLTLKMTKTRMPTQRPIQPKVVYNTRIPPSEGLMVSHHTLDHTYPTTHTSASVHDRTRPSVVDGFASPTTSTNDPSPLSTHSTETDIPETPASSTDSSDSDDSPKIMIGPQAIQLAKTQMEEFAEKSLSQAPINTSDFALPTTITIGVDSDSNDTPGSSSFDLDSELDSPSPSPSPYEPSPHSAMPAGTPVTKGLPGKRGNRADLNRESDGFDSESDASEGDGEEDDAVIDMYIGGKVEPATEVRV